MSLTLIPCISPVVCLFHFFHTVILTSLCNISLCLTSDYLLSPNCISPLTTQIISSMTDVKHVVSLSVCFYTLVQLLPLYVSLCSIIIAPLFLSVFCYTLQHRVSVFLNCWKTEVSFSPRLLFLLLLFFPPSKVQPVSYPNLPKSWPASLSTFSSSISSSLFPLHFTYSLQSNSSTLHHMSSSRNVLLRHFSVWSYLSF